MEIKKDFIPRNFRIRIITRLYYCQLKFCDIYLLICF